MKKCVLLASGIMLAASLGCSSIQMVRTEELPMPSASAKGSIDIVFTPLKDMSKEDISFFKATLAEKFEEAGFTRVAVQRYPGNAAQEVVITLKNYEFTQTQETGKVVASGVCTYLCICVAPIFGLPRYFDDQYELSADVAASRNGRLLFRSTLTEKAHSTANVLEAGSAKFKEELEKLTIHNFVARIVGRMKKY